MFPALSMVRLTEFYKVYATANMLCEKYFIYCGKESPYFNNLVLGALG